MKFTKNLLNSHQLSANAQLRKKFFKKCAAHIIITCATHCTDLQWTSAASVKESKDLQSVLCNACSVPSIRELLIWDNSLDAPEGDRVLTQDVLSHVLKILQPRLTKATWKGEPICRHVYKWCLMQMKHPHLGEHLDMVLPPALLFTDDYQMHNKILGIECLTHIITEVDATELKWHNRAGVVYEAVHSQIYSNKAPLLDVVIPCILGILGVIEKSPKIADGVRNVNRYDEVLQVLLMNMMGEQVIVLRRLYLRHVPLFVDKMGITIVRHIKPLLRIITSYIEVSDSQDEEGRLYTLHLINCLIQAAGFRLPRHSDVLLKALLKLLYDSCLQDFNSNQQVTTKIQLSVVDTLRNLQSVCYDSVNQNLKQVIKSEVKRVPRFIDYVKQVVGVSPAKL
ncbi:TELO2-interacting protein 2-like [Anneissia japonica]|uniref:TELO2-interacting protein 2-like n=1 Tax=Anneissia japonica TaxID=1529436 RepID=UPI0014255EA3|nr:TELO2-interacting protein 2-like [Anneissia japonica]